MSASEDIVDRIRVWADGVEKQKGIVLAVAIREAADEIERLREELRDARFTRDNLQEWKDSRDEFWRDRAKRRDKDREDLALAHAAVVGALRAQIVDATHERDEARELFRQENPDKAYEYWMLEAQR